MTRRYYTPQLLNQSPSVELPQEEAVHATRVMRVGVGDTIELFDGQGHQAAATVTHVRRRECLCHCETPQLVDRDPSTRLELVVAMPKPEPAKEMIERLTELGVAGIQPLIFERTQRPPTDSLFNRLQRIVIEACKQSGRNHLMSIAPVMPFAKWVSIMDGHEDGNGEITNLSEEHSAPLRFVAMPGGQAMQDVVSSVGADHGRAVLQCLIGPEGGLTEEELAACCHGGMTPIDLGKRILRIETSACLIASRFLWD